MREREKRILVVDDDDAIRMLLLTILRRRGLVVDSARHGGEAVELFDRCAYSVVLLDLMMPQLNGWEVLAHLEQLPEESRPLVIVLTAGNEPRDLNPKLVAGTVRKPFDVELLLDTITACMGTLPDKDQLDNCPPANDEKRPSEPGEKVN